MSLKVSFRVDADACMGVGHLMRCLLLAQHLKLNGARVDFYVHKPNIEILDVLNSADVNLITLTDSQQFDTDFLNQALKEKDSSSLIMDGYHFSDDYLDSLRIEKMFVFDDGLRSQIPAQAILISPVNSDNYKNINGSQLRVGSEYCLINPKIREFKVKSLKESIEELMVFMGGSDPYELMPWLIIQGLEEIMSLNLFMGPRAGLNTSKEFNHDKIKLTSFQKEPWKFYAQADLALIAAGSISWELAYLGVPMLLIQTASNQHYLIQTFIENHGALFVGHGERLKLEGAEFIKRNILFLKKDFSFRKRLSSQAAKLVDGFGIERVMSIILKKQIWSRLVGEQDKKMVFDLANDPLARSNSFVSKEITWGEHCEWFDQRLQKTHCPFYIVQDLNNEVVGLVRFDEKIPSEYVISINLAPKFRGKGLGRLLIEESLFKLKQNFKVNKISAVVKESNTSSIKSFLKAGFIENGHSLQYGNEAFEFIYKGDLNV